MTPPDFIGSLFGIAFLVFIALAALILAIAALVDRNGVSFAEDAIWSLAALVVSGVFGIFSYAAIYGFISAL